MRKSAVFLSVVLVGVCAKSFCQNATPEIWLQSAELHANGRFARYFGISVATDRNILVVGASHNAGKAYVFVKPPGGWQDAEPKYTLASSDGASGDFFGQSVAISGNTVVVGTPVKNSYQGAAYVFVPPKAGSSQRPIGTIGETAKLTASDGRAGDEFGSKGSISIVGDVIAIGAPEAWVGNNQAQGAVYIFVKPKGGWRTMTETLKLVASDGQAGDSFGVSTGLTPDTLVVGAYDAQVGSNQYQGKVYVFKKLGGQVKQVAALSASDGASGDSLGITVSVSGNTVVAGAPSNNKGTGAAYVFVEPESGWMDMTQTAKLTASDGRAGALMEAVSIKDKSIVTGAIYPNFSAGSAYLYVEPIGGWTDMTETAILTPSDGQINDDFGASVAVTTDTILVGSPAHFIAPDFYGAAYVFTQQQ